MIWILVVLGALVATATVIAPSLYKTQVKARAEGEDAMVQKLARGIEASVRRNQVIPGPNTWQQAVATELGMDLTSVRQVFPQFPLSPTTRRVLLIDPLFGPATGAPILPYVQAASGLDVLAASIPGINTRVLIASSSHPTLPLPFTSGILPSGLFDSLWDYVPDGTGNSPLVGMSPAWAGRGDNLHVAQLDLRPLFHTISFRRLKYSVAGSADITVPETAQRYFLSGTTLDLSPLTNTMHVVRHVVRGEASFDLSSPYEPLGWWRFELGFGPGVVTNYGKLGSAENLIRTNGVGPLSQGPAAPAQSAYPTNNLALSFDGVDDFLDAGNSPMNGLTQFTLACWISPADIPVTTVAFCGQSGVVEFGMGPGNTLKVVTGSAGTVTTAYPYSTNEWHHVAITGDGSLLRLYLDGSLLQTGGSPPPGGNYGTTATPFRVGGGSVFDAGGNYFLGGLDEVLLFDKALSVAQLLGLTLNQVPQ